MTRHLVEAGHQVTVASRSRGPIDAAVAAGAIEGDGPRGVVDASEITLLCVPNSPEVVEVLDAALPALGPGKIVVDTLDHRPRGRARPARAGHGDRRRLPRGAALGRHRRRARTARSRSWSAATPPRSTRRARRSSPFAGLIVHVGGPGMGQVVKLCNNLDLRRADARDRGGDGDGRARPASTSRSSTRCSPTRRGDCVAVRTRTPGRRASSPTARRRTAGRPAS